MRPENFQQGRAAFDPTCMAGAAIMVVDDHPSNVLLLQEMLQRKGYRVRPFLRAADAIDSARTDPPDLILLDISMPGLSGFEACNILKQESELAPIPVIFLSAMNQTAGKVEAFRCGGVDYISKPFEFDEVHARVETHLKLYALQRSLHDHNAHLETIVESRTRDLAQAHTQLSRLDEVKSDFLHMISHELRTPLNGLLGAAELILAEVQSIPHASELAEMLSESRERILSLVDSALLLTQIEIEEGRFQSEEVCIQQLMQGAAQRAGRLSANRHVVIEVPQQEMGWTIGNPQMLIRAWQALLETAVKFSRPGGSVRIRPKQQSGAMELAVETTTGTIPAPALADFFHLFGVSESASPAGNLGLDPAMAKRVLVLWGNTVEVENLDPDGIRISVRCPLARKPAEIAVTAI